MENRFRTEGERGSFWLGLGLGLGFRSLDKRGLERREREVEEENGEKKVKDKGFLS